jgi:hypothetical protein
MTKHCTIQTIATLFVSLLLNLSAAAQIIDPGTGGVSLKKGLRFASATLSLGDKKAENDNQLFQYIIKQKKNNFEVRVETGYMINDHLGTGLGFLYGNANETNILKASDGTITENKIAEKYFAFRPFVKNFIPLGKSHRFYVVIPTELQIGHGNKVQESTTDNVLTRTFTTSNYYGIAMRPGLLAFIYKNFGCEVNVGALGLNARYDKTKQTNLPDSKVETHDLDLKINILNLSLGFSLYF